MWQCTDGDKTILILNWKVLRLMGGGEAGIG